MSKRFILLTKDAFFRGYLPAYGNKYWKTPNIDELASKGTVFTNYYTSAPSSAMAYLGMFTGLFAHENGIKDFKPIDGLNFHSFFEDFHKKGFKCHIVWDAKWMSTAKKYSECYGKNTVFHPIEELRQGVGVHYVHYEPLPLHPELEEQTFEKIKNVLDEIAEDKGNIVVWMHLPHVLNGRNCYGSDIDMFDTIVGIVRNYFDDDSIYISADHGNMNSEKNKICYGFDVYQPAINIPLISPRVDNMPICDLNFSSVDIFDFVVNKKIKKRDFIYSDSAYYQQPNRKLAIIYKNYKYIYNSKNKTEELYDLSYDHHENCNLLKEKIYDVDRTAYVFLKELYFYPFWDEAYSALKLLREEKNRIWKNPSFFGRINKSIRNILKKIYFRTNVFKRKIK